MPSPHRGPDVPGMSAADHAELDSLLALLAADTWPTDIDEARRFYDAWGTPVAPDITVDEREVGGVPAFLLTPPAADSTRIGIWLHGGGYTFGSQQSHGSMVAECARAAGFGFLHLQYRRAPEHRYPAALEDAVGAYAALLAEGWPPEAVVLVGDSAGGGLAFATLLAARDRGLPMPQAVAVISPWVDLAGTGKTLDSLEDDDPLMQKSVVAQVAESYLGDLPRDLPYASALYGDLSGFPPVLVQVGEREMLLSDAERIAAKLRQSGSPVALEVWPGMVHVWHLHHARLAKAQEALSRLGGFLRSQVPASA
jgi:epsilon-lactone hydrolase